MAEQSLECCLGCSNKLLSHHHHACKGNATEFSEQETWRQGKDRSLLVSREGERSLLQQFLEQRTLACLWMLRAVIMFLHIIRSKKGS
jgi:hypothetical protein